MARVAIYLAVKNMIKPGQKVLMSPYTIVDVVNMVIAAGGIPQFVDVDPRSGNMCPLTLEKTEKSNVGLILVTHLHGIAAEIEELTAIASRHGIPVLEDVAQAMGATVADGRKLGTIGAAGVFSFGSYKNVNSLFGGLLITDDATLAQQVRAEVASWPYFAKRHILRKVKEITQINLLGGHWLYPYTLFPIFRYGFLRDIAAINRITAIELETDLRPSLKSYYMGRYTPMQARMALPQLGNLEENNLVRIAKAELYFAKLQDTVSMKLPPKPLGERHIYTYFPLLAKNRQNLLKWLMFHGRDIAPQHLKNCAELPDFAHFGDPCPVASEVARSVVLFPTYPSYNNLQIANNTFVTNLYIGSGETPFSLGQGSDAKILLPN